MFRRSYSALAALAALLLAPGFAAAQAEKPTDITGSWERTTETPAGNFTSTLKIERTGEALIGRAIGRDGKESKLNNLKLTGNTISFEQDVSIQGMDYHVVYTGAVEGDRIKGTLTADGQTMNWSAKRLAATPETPLGGSATVSAAGTWKLTTDSPNGPQERTLILKQEGDKLTGTVTGPMDRVIPLEDVSLKGKELRFTTSFDRNGATVKRAYVATLEGDTLKGTIEGGQTPRSFTGKREAAAAAPLAGTWKIATQAPDQTYHSTLTLTEQDGKWGGKFLTEQGAEEPLKDVVVKGKQLDFTVDLHFNGMEIHLVFSGAVDGDQLKGSMTANGQTMPTTGARAPKA